MDTLKRAAEPTAADLVVDPEVVARWGTRLYAWSMETHAEVVQRWRDLRDMLIEQLDMFEGGALVLRSNGVNISAEAMEDLRRSIFEFDALIAKDEVQNP